MKKACFVVLILSLIFLMGCTQNASIGSEQKIEEKSIQDIIGGIKDYNDFANQTKKAEEQSIVNQTQEESTTTEIEQKTTESVDEEMRINVKCKNSAIVNGGCKWVDQEHTTFDLKIGTISKNDIPGAWFSITGESGGVKEIKRTEDILSNSIRTYTIDYSKLVKELGEIKKFEILPIEIINGTEYACYNQRVYTIPGAYCKEPLPTRVNDDGSINQSVR